MKKQTLEEIGKELDSLIKELDDIRYQAFGRPTLEEQLNELDLSKKIQALTPEELMHWPCCFCKKPYSKHKNIFIRIRCSVLKEIWALKIKLQFFLKWGF